MKKNRHDKRDLKVDRIAYLISGFIRHQLTDKEHDELDEWVVASDDNMKQFEELIDEKNLEANLAWMDKAKSKEHFEKLTKEGKFNKPVRSINKVWLAAAAIILTIGVILFYQFRHKGTGVKNELAMIDSTKLQPGGNRAMLMLADGRIIDLTTAKNGLLLNGEGSHVSKLADGEIVYDEADSGKGLFSIHTLSTPVGGQYQVTLPDGTKVWLNAATKLSYPSQFASSSRSVELLGEAYFEVAKDKDRPFKVSVGGADVEVLGTHFNIMSYSNEPTKEITLLEGSIAVTAKNKVEKLLPGMQAIISGNDLSIQHRADVEEITGWKDGQFIFHDASIESIMRQVERWYDAKVVYQGKVTQQFNATIYRHEPLSKLLHLLELNGYVNFKTENNTIYVLP